MFNNVTHTTTTEEVPDLNRAYSPLTLAQEWPKMGRLLFMLGCSTLGTIMNGFFVASFFVENSLRKKGNVFLACAGLADLIITAGVMPTSAVLLLSGQWDNEQVCRAMHFLTMASTYCYNTFYLMVAGENYFRICRSKRGSHGYSLFVNMRVGFVSSLVFFVCFVASGVGVFMNLDYDYCMRLHYGNFYFKAATGIIFYAVPFVLTIYGLISASVQVRRRARKQIQYRRSYQFDLDNSNTALHIAAYIIFVLGWTPYLIIVHEYPRIGDAKFYNSAWVGICRSVLTSFLYACLNRHFRRAFAHLFNYCCCKSTLSGSFTSRHRRTVEYRHTSGDLRVHILHDCFGGTPSHGSGRGTRVTHDL